MSGAGEVYIQWAKTGQYERRYIGKIYGGKKRLIQWALYLLLPGNAK
jgi:hypothetical protein